MYVHNKYGSFRNIYISNVLIVLPTMIVRLLFAIEIIIQTFSACRLAIHDT